MSVRSAALAEGRVIYDETLTDLPQARLFTPAPDQVANAVEGDAPGRGTVVFMSRTPVDWVLRHYRRGGAIGLCVNDSFFYAGAERTRSFREWRLLYRLRALGLPVPKPVAARFVRRGFVYSADLITERIAALPLSSYLRSRVLAPETWETIGIMLARFHAAGVFHADLTAHNILLDDEGAAWLLDFDRGALRGPGAWKEANLRRLLRSLRKIAPQVTEIPFPDPQWRLLLEAYARPS